MTIHNTILNNKGKVDRLLSIVNSSFFLSIGKPTPWDTTWGDTITDTNPPSPSVSLSIIPETLFYKQPLFQTLAVDSQCGTVDFSSCGQSISTVNNVTLIDLSNTSLETLYAITPNYIYFRIDITQEDLNNQSVSSYRTAGLYKGTTFSLPSNQVLYPMSSVTNVGILYWTDFFTPIVNDPSVNKTSTFEILLKV